MDTNRVGDDWPVFAATLMSLDDKVGSHFNSSITSIFSCESVFI